MKNCVQFDDSYFKKTINEYQDWEFAFFRETGQNACDAKAKNVRYQIIEDNDYIKVICEDDGKGMSKNILLEKFLVMGGSYKEEGSVGGFGYAKSIILFCHPNYKIETNKSLLTGSYGRYDDPTDIENIHGTKITILMDKESTRTYRLIDRLKSWVNNSYIKGTKFFLNDEEILQSNKKLQYVSNTKIGELQFDTEKSEYSYSSVLWVRMRGMAMFKKNIYTNDTHFKGFIDLDAESSIECLTANRDGLKPDYDNSLNSLINNLSNEINQLKISDMEDFELNKIVNNYRERSSIKDNDDIPFSDDLTPQDRIHRVGYETEKNVIMDVREQKKLVEKEKTKKNELQDKIDLIIQKIDSETYPFNFKIMIDNLENKSNREVLKTFNNAKNVLNQKRIQSVSHKWIKIVDAVLKVAEKSALVPVREEDDGFYMYGQKINYGVIISNKHSLLGACKEENNSQYILFNPVKIKNENYTNFDLLQIAIHEISHLLIKNHNDEHSYLDFALRKTFNDAKININKL